MKHHSQPFVRSNECPCEYPSQGITRRVLGYDDNVMVVKINFEKDAGRELQLHSHPHSQSSYIVSGEFEAVIGDERRTLGAGDAFHVLPDVPHNLICLQGGEVIDTFSPVREDFITSKTSMPMKP